MQTRSNVETEAHRLLVDFHTGRAADAPDWAALALAAGRDGPNLRMLASIERSANWFEVRDYVQPALEEAGLPFLSADAALREHARDIACAILRGEVSPRFGCRMLSRLAIKLDYPAELMDWYALDDAYDLVAEGYVVAAEQVKGGDLDEESRRAASALAPECAGVNAGASNPRSQADEKRGCLASLVGRR